MSKGWINCDIIWVSNLSANCNRINYLWNKITKHLICGFQSQVDTKHEHRYQYSLIKSTKHVWLMNYCYKCLWFPLQGCKISVKTNNDNSQATTHWYLIYKRVNQTKPKNFILLNWILITKKKLIWSFKKFVWKRRKLYW